MMIERTAIDGVYLIEPEPVGDERGSFARVFCRDEFRAAGLDPAVSQCSLSWQRRAGTLRGLHLQAAPHGEAKLIRCVRGAIHDVAVDVRPNSPTRGQHVVAELTADNRRAIYIAAGLAHGFQSLADDTEILYQMSTPYVPGSQVGYHHASPALGIYWPLPISTLSDKDAALPAFATVV